MPANYYHAARLFAPFSIFLLLVEFMLQSRDHQSIFQVFSNNIHTQVLMLAYVACCVTSVLGKSLIDESITKSKSLKTILSTLHAYDSIAILILGASLYFNNFWGILLSVLVISNFSFLYLFNRMITADKSVDIPDEILNTTRAFLHHLGSFIFLKDGTTIILTTIWRAVSMSGHAVLFFKDRMNNDTYVAVQWIISMLRMLTVAIVLALCITYPAIRHGFAVSAVGHVAYLANRFGPVYKLGANFLGKDKSLWLEMTDAQRLSALVSGKYKWLAAELSLLLFASLYFLVCRASLLFDGQTNYFLNDS